MLKDEAIQICRLIAGLVVTDDDLDPSEDAFIDRMLVSFSIPTTDRPLIFPIVDAAEAAEALRAMSPDAQDRTLALLIEAAAVDGKIAPEERVYLTAVADVLQITHDDLDKRLHDQLTRVKDGG
jgi:uncharacterized tellurite resistance protein B-like protein